MDTTVVVLVLIALVVVGAAVMFANSRRGRALQAHYGPEYRRAVEETGDRRKAEAELALREKRVKALEIRPLAAAEQRSFSDAWRSVQAEFVENPNRAIVRADQLLGDVMAVRGYPVSDFDQRAADLSVEHPTLVHNYRVGVADKLGRRSTTLGCLIDGRDHCLHVLRFRFRSSSRKTFLHLAQASKDASIAERAHRRLTSALGGGFCVGH